jgi:hypothetical protein
MDSGYTWRWGRGKKTLRKEKEKKARKPAKQERENEYQTPAVPCMYVRVRKSVRTMHRSRHRWRQLKRKSTRFPPLPNFCCVIFFPLFLSASFNCHAPPKCQTPTVEKKKEGRKKEEKKRTRFVSRQRFFALLSTLHTRKNSSFYQKNLKPVSHTMPSLDILQWNANADI